MSNLSLPYCMAEVWRLYHTLMLVCACDKLNCMWQVRHCRDQCHGLYLWVRVVV